MPFLAGAFYPSSYPQSRAWETKELLGEYLSYLAASDEEREKYHPFSSENRQHLLNSNLGRQKLEMRKREVMAEVHFRLIEIWRGVAAEKVLPPRPKQKKGKWVHPARDESIAFEVLRLVYIEKMKEPDAKRRVQDAFEEELGDDIGMDTVGKAVTKWRRHAWYTEASIKLYAEFLRANRIISE